MNRKEKKVFGLLLIFHIYCLISGWFNGGRKVEYPGNFFWHFLAWWCTWNSILTLGFLLWKIIKRPKTDTYFYQVFSLIVMISNLITVLVYGLGLIIWLTTALTTYAGITSRTTKWVPIPSHKIGEMEVGKVIQFWSYSPLWHFIAPGYFIIWFFRQEWSALTKKKLRLTILLSLIQPSLYFCYGFLRTRLSDREYFKKFRARWVLPFLSSKKMANKLGLGSDYRFIWKIILALSWFSLFSLIVYFTFRYRKKIKNYLVRKEKKDKNLKMPLVFRIKRKSKNY
ncbi:MAG: hypothetical protein I3273_07845 [Candidatus Moeniiplasma glomeromycotorum]|nr:hypothetical protein [Candidatus Moeniiplasma glomeromycotorum]MCE8168177.1 hypothetical protein [Candidatus Moeniiplasma glomeromycotorum]MCE8169992.1 hypothetical protein [Candidatus Moeniiplasma glomeromycotorum]